MKTEELNKLIDLQSKINMIKEELEKINDTNELTLNLKGVYIHPKNIPHLTDELFHIIRERYENELYKLLNQFNKIHLCIQVKSKGPDYLPISIFEDIAKITKP
jgi:hypothetical protein